MNVDSFIKVVENYKGTLSIPNRATTTYMVCFVRDLAKVNGDEELRSKLDDLAGELESMDTSEIASKTNIWR